VSGCFRWDWAREARSEALAENENGLDGGRVEAVLQGAYPVAGDLRTYALGSDGDARATVTIRGCTLSLDPVAERVPHGPTHLRATSGPLDRQLAISLTTK